jgi:hypothetical protein
MNRYLAILLLLTGSCNWAAIDRDQAMAVATGLMEDLRAHRYDRLDDYYTASFNESEPLAAKTEKYKKLNAAAGDIVSWELTGSSLDNSSDNGGPKISLTYRVRCSRVTLEHTLVIINDEGHHRIAYQNWESR